MPKDLILDNFPTFSFAIAAVLALILLLIEHHSKQKLLEDKSQLLLEKAQEKSYSILHRAIKKAQSILGRAELEGVTIATRSKFESRKMEKKYEEQFASWIDSMEKSYLSELTQAQANFIKLLADLKVSSEQAQQLTQEMTKQRINGMFENFEQSLSSFLTQTEQKSTSAIELELKAARELIETYKRQQLSLIDESIVAMLEKTLSLVITKKLTLKDQIGLVYEALEKAKAEKFIV